MKEDAGPRYSTAHLGTCIALLMVLFWFATRRICFGPGLRVRALINDLVFFEIKIFKQTLIFFIFFFCGGTLGDDQVL